MGDAARLFVALELPADARAALAAWRAPLLRDADGALRPVPTASLHMTLCFLGVRPVAEIDAIGAAVETVARGAALGPLAASEAVWLPSRRPRALAVALRDADGALGALQARLADALVAGGWYARERRRFLPHVTVARVRDAVRLGAPAAVPIPPLALSIAASAVALLRSHLGHGPARYESLARVPLA